MLHSFEIHVTQCRDLFEKRESLKPMKERRKCPTEPLAMAAYTQTSGKNGSIMSRKDLDAINAASQQTWTAESLVKCQFCNRAFLPEKIKIHNKSCTADNPARKVSDPVSRRAADSSYTPSYEQNGGNYDAAGGYDGAADNTDFIRCKECGRSFNGNSYAR